MFYLKSPLNRDVFTIMLLETELILKLLVCYAIVCIYYFKYLVSILPNSQRIYRYKDYGKKKEFFTVTYLSISVNSSF